MKRKKLVPYLLVSSLVLSILSSSLTVFADSAFTENENELVGEQKVPTKIDGENRAVTPKRGITGTCAWVLDAEGILTIGAGNISAPKGDILPTGTVSKVILDGPIIYTDNSIVNPFYGNTTATYENIENLDLSKAKKIEAFFYLNKNLKSMDLSQLDLSNIEKMNSMFGHCESLESVNLNGVDTSKVTAFSSMFSSCKSLTTLDLSDVDMRSSSSKTNQNFLSDTSNLKSLTLGKYNTYLEQSALPAIDTTSGLYTGGWKKTDGTKVFESSEAFMNEYNPEIDAGTYEWELVEAAPVTVNYVDENGVELATSDILTGEIGEAYATSAKDILGYELKETPKNATGTFSSSNQTVTYVYQAVQGGNVTVHYVDTEGNTLVESDVLTGIFGSSFESEAKNITGYELKETPENATGTFTEEAQSVTYVYQAMKGGAITVNYEDTNGKILETLTLTGRFNESYKTEVKKFEGYTLKTTPKNDEGIFTLTPQTVTYVYEENVAIPFAVNYVGVQQQQVVGFVPEGVTTSQVSLMIKKDGSNEWVDTGYTAAPEADTGYFAIESRFVKDTRNFLLNNKDQIKVVFTAENGDNYEGIQVVQPYTAPVVNDFIEGDEYLIGSVPNGANQVRISVNGKPMRVVNNGPIIEDNAGINAVTGSFSIWAKTWFEGLYGSSPIHQTKTGDVITVDYGVQIYGAFNNPSTTIVVK